MHLSLDQSNTVNLVTSVSPDEVRVGETVIRESVIIGTRNIIRDWPVASTQNLDESHMARVMELEPELVLLGTGRQLVFPDRQIFGFVLERNVGFEVMDTAAACRTFNVLAGEAREVVAALILD